MKEEMEQSWVGGRWFSLWIHITKSQKGHTHTRPPRSDHPWFLWETAQLPLPGQHKPDQGEESGREPSSWVSHGLSSVKAEGVPVVGEGENCDTFYRIAMLVWCHEPTVVPPKPKVIQKSSSISCFTGMNFYGTLSYNHEDCFRRRLSESLQMVFAAMKLKDAYSLERKLWPT